MDCTEKQLAERLREFKSRSKGKAILVSSLYVAILLFLFVGNILTLLVMLLKRRMRTIPNMFVASLAVSDLPKGISSAAPLGIPTLVTSHWPFNDKTCQFQGFIIITLVGFALIHTMVLMAVNNLCFCLLLLENLQNSSPSQRQFPSPRQFSKLGKRRR